MHGRQLSIGQVIGGVILGATAISPGLALAGFQRGTVWPLLLWLGVSAGGGFVAGLLVAPGHRMAGAIGGMLGAPLGMLALYFYARGRVSIYRAEAVVVWLVGSLPGVGVYFVLRLLTDLLFPAPREDEAQYDDRPRRKNLRYAKDDDGDKPSRSRRGYDDERPRRRGDNDAD